MPSSKLWAILAAKEFRHETVRELAAKNLVPIFSSEDFFLFEGDAREIAWAAVTWKKVERLSFSSINDAGKKMRPLARLWDYLPLAHSGRGKLIFEQLRALKKNDQKLVAFPSQLSLPEGAGAFTLMNENEILWCRDFDRPDPRGEVNFLEDKTSAPSRAYLKLWEALCLLGFWPQKNERTMDLGSCPGGWTWVLASLGAEVLSVDRAPLEPKIAAMPGVIFKKGDAFQVLPTNTEPALWLCSDVICAPEKLLELVKIWIEAGAATHFICTLKFQGEADPGVVAAFQELGRVIHLHHNKHELTFLR